MATAEHVFDIAHFYNEDLDESFDPSDSDDEPSSSSESEDKYSDEFVDKVNKAKKGRHTANKSKGRVKANLPTVQSKLKFKQISETIENTTSTCLPEHDTDEVADLISKLGCLSLNDPSYIALYFCIVTKAPNMGSILSKPALRSGNNMARPTLGQNQWSNNGPFECFFCREKGHRL